jgi:hypothetical protein
MIGWECSMYEGARETTRGKKTLGRSMCRDEIHFTLGLKIDCDERNGMN